MPKRKGASFLPEDTVEGGGLFASEGVVATVVESRLVPRTYPKGDAAGKYFLGLRLKYETEDGQEHEDILSAGSLSLFVPSNDGVKPAGADLEDYEALANGEAELLSEEDVDEMAGKYALSVLVASGDVDPDDAPPLKKSKATFFAEKAIEAGFPVDHAQLVDGDWSCFEGMTARFDRIPYELPGGKQSDEAVATKVLEVGGSPKARGGGKRAAKSAKTRKRRRGKADEEEAEAEASDTHDDAINSAISHALTLKKWEAGIPHGRLSVVLGPKFKGAAKKEALARAVDDNFLSEDNDPNDERDWYFDADDGVIYLYEE